MWRRPRRLGWSARADVALAVAMCALAQVEVVLTGATWPSVFSAALCTLPLAARRRMPLVAAVAVCAAPILDRALGGTWELPGSLFFAALVAGYSVASYAPRRVAVLGGAAVIAGVGLNGWWTAPEGVGSDPIGTTLVLSLAWLAGRMVRSHRVQARQLEALARQLERERDVSARLAVVEEQARMARELHDQIAHEVGQMVVQASAAQAVLETAPARAGSSLRAVQETGREAITELRRLLGILRAPDTDVRPRSDVADTMPQPRRPRARLRGSSGLDVLIALLCAIAAEAEVLTEARYDDPRLASAVLMLAATLPLAVRTRFPLAVVVTSVSAVAIQQVVTDWEGVLPGAFAVAPLIALYTLGTKATARRVVAGATFSIAVALATDTVVMGQLDPWAVLNWPLIVATPLVLARAVRAHRRQEEQQRALTTRLERERDACARLAVMEERARVARELHDAIAHGVSVMVLQAGAAEQVLASATQRAVQAACAIQETGRTVLSELQRLLGVLRSDEEENPRVPRVGLDQLDELLSDVRRAGLPVELRVEGERFPLRAGLDMSAYRVVQEALTNALKHAGRVPTVVRLRYEPDALTLAIVNGGRGALARTAGDAGHGLVGMRERVALYGGEFQAGPQPAGGYAVRLRLPVGDEGR